MSSKLHTSFLPGVTFFQRFLEHIKFSRRLGRNKKTYEFSRRGKTYQNTSISFPGEFSQNSARTLRFSMMKNIIRTDQNFAFSKFCKNRYVFSGDYTPKNRYFVKLPRRMLSRLALNLLVPQSMKNRNNRKELPILNLLVPQTMNN